MVARSCLSPWPPGHHSIAAEAHCVHLDTLRKRAKEAEERAQLQTTINASQERQGQKLVKGVFGLVKEAAQVERLVQFFRGTPELLSEEQARTTDVLIRDMLHLKRVEMARIWRLKVAQVLAQATAASQTHHGQIADDGRVADTSADEGQTDRGEDTEQHPDEHAPHFQTTDGERNLPYPDKQETDHQTTHSGSRSTRGTLYLSFVEASALTGYATDYLRKLVRAGALTTKKSDESRLTTSSVNAYLARHARQKKTERTAEVARLTVLK